jgi:Rad3-related DNA helicase
MSDLASRARGGSILPDHDVAIFDEAHTLANVAAAHLGLRVASGAVGNLQTELDNGLNGGLLAFLKQEDTRLLACGYCTRSMRSSTRSASGSRTMGFRPAGSVPRRACPTRL